MLTKNQMEILQEYVNCKGRFKDQEKRKHFNRTLTRIQENWEVTLRQMVWCAENCGDLFLDEAHELEDEMLEPHRRLKCLFKIMNAVNPRFEVALMVKQDQLRDT